MIIPVRLPAGSYDITLSRGALSRAGEIINLDRKVLVVTDSGVPKEYAEAVSKQCKNAVTVTVLEGEGSKSLETFGELCRALLENGFTRSDCVVAVGGGVVGDLAGFAAASYMRGIDFYNIPTTVLSQVDSSVGGKTAVNFGGIKNIIGAFYQPKAVVIDPDVLKTLTPRHFSNGLAEAVKMSLTFDKELFELFEHEDAAENIETIIERSVRSKAAVVEKDEHEAGLRRVLNFGHTVGHAVESVEGLGGLYHGECVAIGMLPMCGEELRPRVEAVLKKLNLPTKWSGDPKELLFAAAHDKKFSGDFVTIVTLPEIENYRFEKWTGEELLARMEAFFK